MGQDGRGAAQGRRMWTRVGACVGALFLAACGGATAGDSGTPGGTSGGTSNAGSGNGGNSGGGASNGGSGNGGATGQSLCEQYCDAVMTACTGSAAQYASRELCLAACAAMSPGAAGDLKVNTVQCRLGQANLATSGTESPSLACPAAGPGGGGLCGGNCDGLCTLAKAACPNAGLGLATTSSCLDVCAPLADTGSYDISQQSGYTVQCRLYHVTAATLDPSIHCPHVDGNFGPCAAMAH